MYLSFFRNRSKYFKKKLTVLKKNFKKFHIIDFLVTGFSYTYVAIDNYDISARIFHSLFENSSFSRMHVNVVCSSKMANSSLFEAKVNTNLYLFGEPASVVNFYVKDRSIFAMLSIARRFENGEK